jgi:hypothetical protein
MLSAWLSAFLVTQVIECPVYARALAHKRAPWIFAFSVSSITHPVIFFLFPRMWDTNYWEMVLYAEAFAVAAEALYLSVLSVRMSVLWAVLANGLSCAVGLTLRAAFSWP